MYSNTASGGRNQTTNHIYQYSYTIPSGKQLASITLPTNSNVRLLDIQITPPTYTTKQVTVPMGQQKTIAYIAPESNTGMAFFVQQPDGTCVGAICSKFLTDWTSGSGSSNDAAQNISPSLNSQMKAGQQWKMTLQNAGEGYYGYLDSPSGKNLPGPSGSTPGGAQFRLWTQAEMKSQPPWLLAYETVIGTVIVLVGLALLTDGMGDELLAERKLVNVLNESILTEDLDGSRGAVVMVRGAVFETEEGVWERIFTDSWRENPAWIEFNGGNIEVDSNFGQIVGDIEDIPGNQLI